MHSSACTRPSSRPSAARWGVRVITHPWGSVQVLLPLADGDGMLLIMIAWEARSRDPTIPLRFFTSRTRATSNVVSLAVLAPFYGYVVLLTWYMQQVLGYSPLKTGLLWLPLGTGIGAGMGACTALMPRIGVKAVLATGPARQRRRIPRGRTTGCSARRGRPDRLPTANSPARMHWFLGAFAPRTRTICTYRAPV
jgi:hypothetical protein